MDRLVRLSLAAYLPTLLIPIQNLSGLFYFVVPGLFAFQCCFDSCSPFVGFRFYCFPVFFFGKIYDLLAGLLCRECVSCFSIV